MIILDTDHISVLQRPSESRQRLLAKLETCNTLVTTSIITLEEQSKSWIAQIGRRRDVADQVVPYDRLLGMFDFFADWEIVPFSIDAADEFKTLRSDRVRIATTDLKIAAIALANDAVLLTANEIDFERVPNLRFESWLI